VAEIRCAPNRILLCSVRHHSLHQPIRHTYLLLVPAFQLQRGYQRLPTCTAAADQNLVPTHSEVHARSPGRWWLRCAWGAPQLCPLLGMQVRLDGMHSGASSHFLVLPHAAIGDLDEADRDVMRNSRSGSSSSSRCRGVHRLLNFSRQYHTRRPPLPAVWTHAPPNTVYDDSSQLHAPLNGCRCQDSISMCSDWQAAVVRT
jgi:hypothetical protein